jgi:hypothetical protein
VTANSAKLVNRSEPANYRMILNQHVTRQRAVIRKNNIVLHNAIMRDMAVRQKIPPITHPRHRTRGRRAIHRDKFAKTISFPDLQVSGFTRVLQILRLLANRTERMKPVSRSNLHRSADRDMILKPAVGSDADLRANDAIGPNPGTRSDLRAGIDHCGRMNAH